MPIKYCVLKTPSGNELFLKREYSYLPGGESQLSVYCAQQGFCEDDNVYEEESCNLYIVDPGEPAIRSTKLRWSYWPCTPEINDLSKDPNKFQDVLRSLLLHTLDAVYK
jgi:hypothetical protein